MRAQNQALFKEDMFIEIYKNMFRIFFSSKHFLAPKTAHEKKKPSTLRVMSLDQAMKSTETDTELDKYTIIMYVRLKIVKLHAFACCFIRKAMLDYNSLRQCIIELCNVSNIIPIQNIQTHISF